MGQRVRVAALQRSARATRLTAAESECGVSTGAIPGRPDIECRVLGVPAAVPCKCPGGASFELPATCEGADYADGIAAACGEL